ncbi:MAG: ParB N-terminal domain-containing protein [Candidatus Kapaibacterium sp.]
MAFEMKYDIAKCRPASYNPRLLTDDKKELLAQSLSECGVLKPIIVNGNGTIIAGHQRTNAMKLLGITHAPAFIIDGINRTDEVRFNQFHNGADIEISGHPDKIMIDCEREGWNFVSHKSINIIAKGSHNGVLKKELARLLMRYGDFTSCIIDHNGRCIVSSEYAAVCKMLRRDLWIYKCGPELSARVKYYFAQDYGVFSYSHIEKHTYIQSLAQMHRLEGRSKRKSRLYENLVLPNVNKRQRILDFGAGMFAYVNHLSRMGYNIRSLEFYYRKNHDLAIDVKFVNRCIDDLISNIRRNGLFDVVICDSVLNSVDSPESERAVVDTCRALCKPGGLIFLSGRLLDGVNRRRNASISSDKTNYLYFLDLNGFTGNLRYGHWYFQKFHTKSEIKSITRRVGRLIGSDYTTHVFRLMLENSNPLSRADAHKAIDHEFSLPLPGGSYQRASEVREAISNFY